MRQFTSANGVITKVVRYGLPAVLVLAGVVVLLLDDDSSRFDGFALLVGSGLSVALLNLLFRIGVSGDRTRDDEQLAREFFSAHGYWPDEHPDREDLCTATVRAEDSRTNHDHRRKGSA